MYDKDKLKKLGLIAILFVTIIVVLSIILSFIFKPPLSASEEADHGPGDEVTENSMIFEHRYQLNYSIGTSSAATAITQIEAAVLSEDELSSAPHENQPEDNLSNNFYTATLIETSFKKLSDSPEIYSFNLDLTDGRKYKVYIFFKLDFNREAAYTATALTRTDKTSNDYFLYTSSEDNSFLSALHSWAKKNLGIKNPDVTYLSGRPAEN